jgi:L-lactate dehydrogenase complex protein LldF
MTERNDFLIRSEKKAQDIEHKRKLSFNILQYDNTVLKGKTQYLNLENAKKRAKNTKWKAIESLDKYLVEFENHFAKNGGKVIWACNAVEANIAIEKIVKKHNAKMVVKAKSMASEEIELNHHLEKIGIEVYETDLGEYIQQLDGEKPYHIVTPAMHKSKEDVAKLFNTRLGTSLDLTAQELTLVARKNLREKYITADIGFSGANFIIADTGSIAITENEGNARLSTSFPKVHIAIIGIEKVIPSIHDLHYYWPLLSTFGTGQNVTVFNTIISGPKKENEIDGPEEMYVILLDNGRSDLIAKLHMREALYCIRCGACLNACPVYKNIGGHAYNVTYSGPIGSVISPHYEGIEKFSHLSHASSLCGNCTEVCPVKINIHQMLLYNRRDGVKNGNVGAFETLGWKIWKNAMLDRKFLLSNNNLIKNIGFTLFIKNKWSKNRANIEFNEETFNNYWKKNN